MTGLLHRLGAQALGMASPVRPVARLAVLPAPVGQEDAVPRPEAGTGARPAPSPHPRPAEPAPSSSPGRGPSARAATSAPFTEAGPADSRLAGHPAAAVPSPSPAEAGAVAQVSSDLWPADRGPGAEDTLGPAGPTSAGVRPRMQDPATVAARGPRTRQRERPAPAAAPAADPDLDFLPDRTRLDVAGAAPQPLLPLLAPAAPAHVGARHAAGLAPSGLPDPIGSSPVEEITEVHVSIGRIEVTAAPGPHPQPSRRPAADRKAMSLEQYLARRQAGRQ